MTYSPLRPAGRSSRVLFAASAALIFTSSLVSAGAAEDHDHASHDERRHAESHVHGAAELALAQDGDRLVAEFTSPAANLVGFERMAASEAEQNAVRQAIAQLEDGAALFRFSGGACVLADAVVDAEGLLVKGEQHAHDDHDHAEEEGHETHAEFAASYAFDCADAGGLSGIEVGFFETWPAIEALDVVFIGTDRQVAAELSASSPSFELE
ncbi:MAG: DUF2796 domain-containing protein [Parvibaculaceae bacterium]